jgi:DNA-binding transcriptional LysR family regulator
VNLASVDLNLLVAFEALLDERSVSRAAARVGLSQPAMSNALARLRAVFDDRLFERAAGGMAPTPRAEQLRGPLRAGLAQLRRAFEGETSFDPATSPRRFRVAATDYVEWLLAGPLAAALSRQAPGVQIQLRRLDRLFVAPEAALRAGEIDLAIGFFPDARSLESGSVSETLLEEQNVVVARQGHPLLRRRLDLDAFAAARHAAVIYRPEPWGLIDTELAARGRRRNLFLAAPHFLTVLRAVSESDLIACVPERLARGLRQSLRLAIRPVPFPLPPFHTRMVWHEHAAGDAALIWLRSVLRAIAAEAAIAPAAPRRTAPAKDGAPLPGTPARRPSPRQVAAR